MKKIIKILDKYLWILAILGLIFLIWWHLLGKKALTIYAENKACETFFDVQNFDGICNNSKKLQYRNIMPHGRWCMVVEDQGFAKSRRIIDFVEPILEQKTTYDTVKRHVLTYHAKSNVTFKEDHDIGSRSYTIFGHGIDNEIGIEPFWGGQPFVISSPSHTCDVTNLKEIAKVLLPKFIENTFVNDDESMKLGIIEGAMTYPSHGVPSDIIVCAENIVSKKQFCTNRQVKDKQYRSGIGYKITAPADYYHVFSIPPDMWKGNKDYRAYYSEYVLCTKVKKPKTCTSHQPIIVRVEAGKTSHADPTDWYK